MQINIKSFRQPSAGQRNTRRVLAILHPFLFLFLLLIIGWTAMPAFSQSATAFERTQWQMHKGLDHDGDGQGNDVISITLTSTQDSTGFTVMRIPAIDDVGWMEPNLDADGNVFIDEATQEGLRKLGCNRGVDFTYFQTLVTVPKDAAVTNFAVTFAQVDDLARIYVFNSQHQAGQQIEGNDISGNNAQTVDLASLIVTGETNRVVVVQFDSCPVKNHIKNIQINVNGTVVEKATTPIPLPSALQKTDINVCSHKAEDTYNILGANAISLRAKLTNTVNFGPTGTYGNYQFNFKNVGDDFTEQTIVDGGCDIWFSGYEADTDYTETEKQQLQNWVVNHNGQVIAGCDDSTHDPVCDLLGYTVTTGTDTHGFLSNRAVNPINCDASLKPSDQINMSGGAGGYFTGPAVQNVDVLAEHETNNMPDPSQPIVIYTGNYFLTADINMIQTSPAGDPTLSDGPGVTNNNDILAMNAFSALADAASSREVCASAVAKIEGRLYVDHDASGAATGLSWTDAFTNVQDALAIAKSGDQVWVAEGVYYPDVGGKMTDNDRSAAFTLTAGVAIYGGFEGTELTLQLRNWRQHVTVLSGDIDQNDSSATTGVVTATSAITGTNSFHVVHLDGTTNPITGTTVIDGFAITAGQANGTAFPDDAGAGLFCNGFTTGECSPLLENVIFSGNFATGNGGAMLNDGRNGGKSSPALINVIFSGNSAYTGGAIYNAAWDNGNASPLLTNITFSGNSARSWAGGAIFNQGERNGNSSPLLTNVTFSGNSAAQGGGAIYNYGGNQSTTGRSNPTLKNVILWKNSAPVGPSIYNHYATSTISHSIVENGRNSITWTLPITGTLPITTNTYLNNSEADPLFVQPIDPSSAPTATGNLRLQAASPAINLGLNSALAPNVTTDLAGNERILGSAVDAGAYEFQPSTVQGHVVDATTDKALPGAQICIHDSEQCATADATGNYTITNVAATTEQVLEVTASGYTTVTQPFITAPGETHTQNFALSPQLAAGELRIVLMWGENPKDMDSHLWVPGSQPYHVKHDATGTQNEFPFATLDVDDRESHGPETITISQLVTGTYTYAVHHYEGVGSIATSEARVRVYGATGQVVEYTPPADQDGLWWHVFDIIGPSATISAVNVLQADEPVLK